MADSPFDTDVLVIGSGFGGAAAANRLALSGKRVLLLERGPWRDSAPVRSMGIKRRAPFPYGKKAFSHFLHSVHGKFCSLRLNKAGMFEVRSFQGLYTLAVSAVGGGSTAWGSLLEKPRQAAFWQDRHAQLEAESVERYYDKVIADMHGVRLTREQPLPQGIWDHFPVSGDERCTPAAEQPMMAFLFPPTAGQAGQRAESASHSVERHYSAFDGDSILGSRGGAKASVDFIYLAPVLGKGLEVRDLCEVLRIRPATATPGSGYVVEFKDHASGRSETVRAARVVMAAGTLNTVRLLFASSGAGGLASMPALGKGFFANGDLLGAWIQPAGSRSSFRSAPIYGTIDVAGVDVSPLGVGGLAGFDSWPLPGFIKRFLARVSVMYGMDVDSSQSSISYRNGRLHSDYDQHREPIYARLRKAFRIVSEASGSTMYPMRKPLTPHAGGGARIGCNAQEGVIDHRGEVYGNPGLFVVDASALPAAPGGPPAVTIASWAHHVADGIAQHR
jgi:cholesterol oxidase